MATVSYPLPEKDSKSKPLRTNAAQKYDSRTFPIEGQWAETERQSEPGGSVGEIIIDARWGEKRGRLHHLFKKKFFEYHVR
jgi:hypothetical protein